MIMTTVQATALAQALMRDALGGRAVGPPDRPPSVLRIDGRWGTYTNWVYSREIDDQTRKRIDRLLSDLGTSAEALNAVRLGERAVVGYDMRDKLTPGGLRRFFDFTAVAAAIRGGLDSVRAVQRLTATGVSQARAKQIVEVIAGREIVDLEAARSSDGLYDAMSRNSGSSAAGVFQFLSGTWNEVVRALKAQGVSVPLMELDLKKSAGLRTYDAPGAPFDLVASATVFAEFTLRNAIALIRAGFAVNPATLYTLHQQGAAGGLDVLRGGPLTAPDRQSTKSLAVIAQAVASARLPTRSA